MKYDDFFLPMIFVPNCEVDAKPAPGVIFRPMREKAVDFDTVLSPIGVEDFLATYRERQHLVLRREQPVGGRESKRFKTSAAGAATCRERRAFSCVRPEAQQAVIMGGEAYQRVGLGLEFRQPLDRSIELEEL